jgi:MoaA/NifB/PqqE/SkfB family radical SAM enzyme
MREITKRIDLNLGYTCNIRCRFCYYQESMVSQDKKCRRDLTTQEAKKWLLFFRKKGKTGIDLTGGEPTIRKDIAQLVKYSRDIGYTTICVITNGMMLAEKSFAEELARSGLNDVLFSLHGPNSDIHDNLTQTKGSFERLLSAMDNLAECKIKCRSNTVVNGLSYRYLDETAELLWRKGIRVANFILFNPIVEAQGSDAQMNLTYYQAAPYLAKVIDKYSSLFERISVRYIPFCALPGYERYITNTPQIQYDPYEWDYYWRTYFRNGPLIWSLALLFGFFLHPAPLRLLKLDFDSAKHEAIKWSLAFKNRIKGQQCRRCAYYKICDGLWRDYAKKMGFKELTPIAGKKISDPAYFLP